MARKLAIEIVGSAASLKAALGSAAAATEKFAAGYKASFAGMTDATLALAVAEDKLAISTARYGVGTTGAAKATAMYRREVQSLAASQTAAMGTIGRSLTTGVTIPTALIGYAAVKMGIQFSQNMIMIQTQAGASAKEVKNLSGEVLELSKISAQSPVELAKGLYHLESLGLRGAKAMEALRISSLAAGMGIADLEDVATALGGAIVAGTKGTGDYSAAMGTINATIGVGNMRMEEMAAALGTGLLPAAKNAGLTLAQVGAALAVLTDRGISAENAGTRLRMTFALMQAPSDKAKKALADMGIDSEDMANKLRGPNGLLVVLRMLKKAQESVGEVRGSRDILKAFGGGRSGAGILTLVQSLDSPVSSYQGKLEDIIKGQKKWGDNVKVYMESPAYRLATAINTVKANMTKMGESLYPAVQGFASAIGAITNAFQALPAPIRKDLGVIVGLLAVGGPVFLAVAAVRRMIVSLGTTFATLPLKAGPAIAVTNAEMATLGTTAEATSVKVGLVSKAYLGLAKAGPITLAVLFTAQFAYPWIKNMLEKYAGADFQGTKTGNGVQKADMGVRRVKMSDGKTIIVDNKGREYSLEGWAKHKRIEELKKTRKFFDQIPGTGPGQRKPDPLTKLPQSFTNAGYWAVMTDSLKDDLQVAKTVEAFWRKQLSYAEKGTPQYNEILQSLALAHKDVTSAATAIASDTKKKAGKVASFKLPPSLAEQISKAQGSGNLERELKVLERVAAYLRKRIAGEKSVAKRALEQKSLAGTMDKIRSIRKEIGKKIISSFDKKYSLAQATPGISDDIKRLTELRAVLVKQLALQKNNVDLINKLADVDKEFVQIRQNLIDQLRGTMGGLGSGPGIDPENDPLRKWMLGVRYSAKQYTEDLQKQIGEFKKLEAGLGKLGKRGAPQALLDELRGQGMAAFPEVFALANADKGTLQKFFAAYKEREKLIANTATAEIRANTVNLHGAMIVWGGQASKGPGGIPAMAKGGVVRKPTVALIGEAGPEAVVPLKKLRELYMNDIWPDPKKRTYFEKMLGHIPQKDHLKRIHHWLLGTDVGLGRAALDLFEPFRKFYSHPGFGTGVSALAMLPIGPRMKGGYFKSIEGRPANFAEYGRVSAAERAKWNKEGLVLYHNGPVREENMAGTKITNKPLRKIARKGLLPGGGREGAAHPGQDWTPNFRGVYAHEGDPGWAREVARQANEYMEVGEYGVYKIAIPPGRAKWLARDEEDAIAYTRRVPPEWVSVDIGGKFVPVKEAVRGTKYPGPKKSSLPGAPWIKLPKIKGLTKSETESIWHYQDETGSSLNAALREWDLGHKMHPRDREQMMALDRAMKPLPSSRTFWRGMPKSFFGDGDLRSSIGRVYTDNAFLSVTTNRGIADDFAGLAGWSDPSTMGVVLRLHVPKGTKALDTEAWGFAMDEFVLPRGSKFKVDNVIHGNAEHPTVLAHMIPKLAKGGVVSRPTLAMIGEAGPEAVVPLSRGMGGGGSTVVVLELDGREITRVVLPHLQQMSRSNVQQTRGRYGGRSLGVS